METITGDKQYFYSINLTTRSKEYFKMLKAEKIYNDYEECYTYFHAKVSRCKLVKIDEYDVPIDGFKNKEFKRVERFELKPYGRKITCHDSIMGYELTTNIIVKDK
jgi:hypothetical protein